MNVAAALLSFVLGVLVFGGIFFVFDYGITALTSMVDIYHPTIYAFISFLWAIFPAGFAFSWGLKHLNPGGTYQ